MLGEFSSFEAWHQTHCLQYHGWLLLQIELHEPANSVMACVVQLALRAQSMPCLGCCAHVRRTLESSAALSVAVEVGGCHVAK